MEFKRGFTDTTDNCHLYAYLNDIISFKINNM